MLQGPAAGQQPKSDDEDQGPKSASRALARDRRPPLRGGHQPEAQPGANLPGLPQVSKA